MSDYLASTTKVKQWISGLATKDAVYFPQPHGAKSYRFSKLEHTSTVQFEQYLPTIAPPVKLLTPASEELFRFSNQDGKVEVTPATDTSFRILAGVRPCDLKGIYLMDLFFKDGTADPYYMTRRQNTAIIAHACTEPCDKRAFCAAVDSLDHREGADVFLTPVKGGDLLVEVLTDLGQKLMDGIDFDTCDDGPARKVGAVAARPEAFGRGFSVPANQLPGIIEAQWDSAIWDKHVERCFSCGTCNLVCPTCYCFDVHDAVNIDGVSGARARTWDACMLPHFASVAGGHNFRPQPAGRQRHRVKRKFEYLPHKYQHGAACTGCGRCGRQCTSGIDIYDIVCDLIEAGGQS